MKHLQQRIFQFQVKHQPIQQRRPKFHEGMSLFHLAYDRQPLVEESLIDLANSQLMSELGHHCSIQLMVLLFELQQMYGKIHERKITQKDYLLSCEEARKQLDEYIDTENRRVNIDSAKKLAVVQHMDYQGFRQMVLGANIFPTKSKQLTAFSKGQEEQAIVQNKAFDQKKVEQEVKDLHRRIEGNSQKHCFSFRDFKKKFAKSYDKELSWERAQECYHLIKQQDRSRLEKIFNLECQADILLKIAEVFIFVLDFVRKEGKALDAKVECGFMIKWLQTVLSIPTMQDISLNILTKKQREKIATFLQSCKQILNEQVQIMTLKTVVQLIRK